MYFKLKSEDTLTSFACNKRIKFFLMPNGTHWAMP